MVILEDSAILMDLRVLEGALEIDVEPVATDMDLDLLELSLSLSPLVFFGQYISLSSHASAIALLKS